MQNDKFNNILKDRAKEFVLLPNANAFENMLALRKKAKRKRIVVFMVFFAFLMSFGTTVFFINNKHSEPIESNKTITLKSEPNLSNTPIIAEKIIKNNTDKIIVDESNKPIKSTKIYTPIGVDSEPEMLIGVKGKQGKLNIVTSANEVDLNKNETIFHHKNLQEIKKTIAFQDTALLVKTVIDSNNADTNLTDKEISAKAINDTVGGALIANNVASSKNNYKTKEPIHFSLS
ncbi:MAG: hypothetical protein JHD28_02020, partial [Bacteroidia bacterium]|nr:hypothetical protein [Bacteroidia bacterium]